MNSINKFISCPTENTRSALCENKLLKLMLLREIIAVHCETHAEHEYTV
jgi:hypothetical protein